MQEEVTQKTIALVFKSSRLTADVLKKAMKMYLEHRKQGKQMPHGKISVKELVGQGREIGNHERCGICRGGIGSGGVIDANLL